MGDTSNLRPTNTYSPFVGYAFTVNYIVGVGVLSLPYAFYSAGIALGLILMFLVTIISYLTMVWLCETIARMEVYNEFEQSTKTAVNYGSEKAPLLKAADSDASLNRSSSQVSPNDSDVEGSAFRSTQEIPGYPNNDVNWGKFEISYRKFEINEMIMAFMGRPWARFYDVILFFYIYGGLWGFSSMWGTTLTDTIPFIGITDNITCDSYGTPKMVIGDPCMTAYQIYVVFFAMVVVPLSMLDLSEQIIVQMILCFVRFFCFFAMIGMVIAGISLKPFGKDRDSSSSWGDEGPPYWADVAMFDFSGFGIAFSACVFSQLAQYSVPSIIQPVNDKTKLKGMFMGVLTTTWIFYSIMSALIASYFGAGTKEMISLNWSWPEGEPNEDTPLYEYFFRYVIIFFPVALSISAFPLTAIALGNSIYSALPDKYTNYQSSKPMKYICRLLSSVPAIVLGLFMYDLAIIVQITGTLGVFIAFFFPSYLQYASDKKITQIFSMRMKTPYSGAYSHPYVSFGCVILSIGIFVLSVTFLVLDVTSKN